MRKQFFLVEYLVYWLIIEEQKIRETLEEPSNSEKIPKNLKEAGIKMVRVVMEERKELLDRCFKGEVLNSKLNQYAEEEVLQRTHYEV